LHIIVAFYSKLLYESIMGLPKKLTEMQMKFAHELVTNEGRKTATECAVTAGYEPDSAVVRASELQNAKRYPLVVHYIGQLRDEYQKKYDVTFGRHISELAKLRDNARESKAWSAAVNAEVARGKAAGLYVEQKIIRTGSLSDLTAEQLETRMKEIIEEYSPILEGVVVEDLKEIKSEQLIDEDYSSSSSSSSSSEKSSSESEESHSH
jgi:phage terminase small subunit